MSAPLYLEPRLETGLAELVGDPAFLHQLADGLGSPLNVLAPQQAARNLASFQAVYREHRLRGKVFFAHKANQSSALARRLAATDACVDVASVQELQHALSSGFAPERIAATGPKDPAFLWLGARSGVAFHLDGAAELEQLAGLVRAHRLPRVRVLLRLSGFASTGVRPLLRPSRFGTAATEVGPLLAAVVRCQDAVELLGVGYHLDTVSLDEKALALEGCLAVMDECRALGLRPQVVDIGGGFGTSYLADAAQWDAYTTELTRSALGTRPPLTWRGHGYGLRNEAGTAAGSLALYPAHRRVWGAGYLDALLSAPGPSSGRPLGAQLLESLYDLYTEPGRSMVDQCGLTLARVLEVHREAGAPPDGAWTVRLDMNAADCSLEDHGVLMDPLLIARPGRREEASDPVRVHLFGSLCLESDLITKRLVFLPRLPRVGDLLCFANTAGYCMDFSATWAERRPPAIKVAAYQHEGRWHWSLDDHYWPTASAGDIA